MNKQCPYFEPCTNFHERFMNEVLAYFPELIGDPDVMAVAIINRMLDEGRITHEECWMLEDGYLENVRHKVARLRKEKDVQS